MLTLHPDVLTDLARERAADQIAEAARTRRSRTGSTGAPIRHSAGMALVRTGGWLAGVRVVDLLEAPASV
jgi:hypothetical protein